MDDVLIWLQLPLITGIKGEILKNMVALSPGSGNYNQTNKKSCSIDEESWYGCETLFYDWISR